jgi:hypothetical protein
MFTFIKTDFMKSFLGHLLHSNDTKTTVLGLVIAAVLADKTLDWGKLLNCDSNELGKVVGILAVVLIGYYTNKPNSKPVLK